MGEEFLQYLYGVIFHEVLKNKLYLDECSEFNNYDGTMINYQIQMKNMCFTVVPASTGGGLSSFSSAIASSWNFRLLWEFRFYLWEKLHSYHWSCPRLLVYREWFGMITSMILLFCLSQPSKFSQRQLLHLADIGLLLSPTSSVTVPSSVDLTTTDSSMSSPEKSENSDQTKPPEIHTGLQPIQLRSQSVLQEITEYLQLSFVDRASSSVFPNYSPHSRIALVQKQILSVNLPPTFSVALELSVIDKSDLVTFYQNFFQKQLPVVIKHGCDDFPAFEKWKDINYLTEGKWVRCVYLFFRYCIFSLGLFFCWNSCRRKNCSYRAWLQLSFSSFGNETDDNKRVYFSIYFRTVG
jgi:hypothetical protein